MRSITLRPIKEVKVVMTQGRCPDGSIQTYLSQGHEYRKFRSFTPFVSMEPDGITPTAIFKTRIRFRKKLFESERRFTERITDILYSDLDVWQMNYEPIDNLNNKQNDKTS